MQNPCSLFLNMKQSVKEPDEFSSVTPYEANTQSHANPHGAPPETQCSGNRSRQSGLCILGENEGLVIRGTARQVSFPYSFGIAVRNHAGHF